MKKICMLLVLAMCITLIAGCAPQSPAPAPEVTAAPAPAAPAPEAPAPEPAAADETITIRILTRLSSNQPNAVAFRDRVQQFRDLHPNIIIEDLSIEDEASYDTKLATAVSIGDVPELFQTYGGASYVSYAQNNVALDLSAALDADPVWKNGFLNVFENFQFDAVPGTYAVPYEFFAVALFYNKDLFAQIGAEPPATIEEFEAVADKFMKIGIVPFALGEKDPWRGGHLIANIIDKKLGAKANNDIADRKLKYTDPSMLELFSLIDSWNKKGYFGPQAGAVDHEAEKAMFHSGQTAMHMNGSWYVPEGSASEIADKIGVVPFPYFAGAPQNKEVWMGGAGGAFAVSGTADPAKQAAAIELLKFVTNMDAFKYYQQVQKGGIFPVDLAPDPAICDQLTIDYSSLLGNADFKAEVYSYDPLATMQDKVRNEIQGMFAGQAAQTTAENIQSEIDNS